MNIQIELTDSVMDMLLLQAATEEISAEEIITIAIKHFLERDETDAG